MKFTALLILFAWSFFFICRVDGSEIGFVEKFSLAEDREKVLAELIPGTRDYYFYNCLYAQQRKDFKKARELIKKWTAKYGYTESVKEILNRQALLDYSQNPGKSLKYIKNELDLRFDHKKELADRKDSWPDYLDPELISIPRLTKKALSRYENLRGFEDSGLFILTSEDLNPARRHDLLGRLKLPVYPDLVSLVAGDLKYKHSRGFGSLPVHSMMLKPQLDLLIKKMPGLRDNTKFTEVYLSKLAPSDDVDIRYDISARKEFIKRMWAFAKNLSPVHNSLKANILYNLLDVLRKDGLYDNTLFSEYIKLPRNVPYMAEEYMRKRSTGRYRADLNADFSRFTGLDPIINDTELVEDYLARFFENAKDYKKFSKYIDESYLKKLFARTKILTGYKNADKCYSMLDPEDLKALKERVILSFPATNKEFFRADEPVIIRLDIKNIRNLIIRVFELNTFNYYMKYKKEINATINLDGLSATWEKLEKYDNPPLRRIRKKFEFPRINKPGIFVVEFIGNGKSSRVLIRKGKLDFIEKTSPSGHEFVILDENGKIRKKAIIRMGPREFEPDENGIITIPFTTDPKKEAIIIKDGNFSSIGYFDHLKEEYKLDAGFHIDRESLIRGKKAKIIIRPVLTLCNNPIDISLLDDVRLNIETIDYNKNPSFMKIPGFSLSGDGQSVCEFHVPENLSSVKITLLGKIENITANKKEDLKAEADFSVNQIDSTLFTRDIFFTEKGGDYYLEILDKNGTPLEDVPIGLEIKHKYFREKVHTVLKSGKNGKIMLGPLPLIEWIKVSLKDEISHTFRPMADKYSYPANIHRAEGSIIRIPRIEAGNSKGYILLEKRGGTYIKDYTDHIRVKKGYFEIKGLLAGNYELYMRSVNRKTDIRITKGKPGEDFIVSKTRILETDNKDPLRIELVNIKKDKIFVKLGGISAKTRVHAIGTFFVPAFDAFENLSLKQIAGPLVVKLKRPRSRYLSGRDIGDEYRYILERKYAKKYPGNFLKRPELLLNPWEVAKTGTDMEKLSKGGRYARHADEAGQERLRIQKPASIYKSGPDSFSSLDFLADPSSIILNFKPDKDGIIEIPVKNLKDHPLLHIIATDSKDTAIRHISMPSGTMEKRDIRMAKVLDGQKHFTEQKKISILLKDESFTLKDAAPSSHNIYDSISRAYDLMLTLSKNDTLEKFRFILRWPEMKMAEKFEKYDEFACHELNFFLFRKDRDFFTKIIKPYLSNKKEKTFMDRWLLDDDLSRFLQPFEFSRLNIVEKILLFQKSGKDGDKKRIKKYIKQLFDMIPPDPDLENRLFDIALKGRELEQGPGNMEEVLEEWGKDMEKTDVMEEEIPPLPSARPMPKQEAIRTRSISMTKPMAKAAPPVFMRKAGAKSYAEKRKKIRRFYQKPDKTKEWAENNYYRLPLKDQNDDLIKINPFWRDFALSDNKKPFISGNFFYATGNFSEIMFALSVLDLPYKAEKHEKRTGNSGFSITAKSPLILFHKEISEAKLPEKKLPVLVSQNFFKAGDRYIWEGNERFDKFVKDEFLYGTPYGCQVIITNPTSSPGKLRMLIQIPGGALPLRKGFYSKSFPINIEPYQTLTREYYFFFPKPGLFESYPVQVSKDEKFLAEGTYLKFNVVRKLTKADKRSWEWISQEGTDDQVLEYLKNNNLHRLDLKKIAFRMKNKSFFQKTVKLLKELMIYDNTIWSYGIFHNDPEIIGEYLPNTGFAKRCGYYIDSPILKIDPFEMGLYEHLEYKPLINARVHMVGKKRKILNDRFFMQYTKFMKTLRYKAKPCSADFMEIVYYLLLQDRIDEALSFFKRIRYKEIDSQVQYDYAKTYLDFYLGSLKDVRKTAEKYAKYPVPGWQKRFKAALKILDKLEGKKTGIIDSKDRQEQMEILAATEPFLDFKIENRTINISYKNIEKCRINYYPMDIELLFSKNPFMKQNSEQFTFIRPGRFDIVDLPSGKTKLSLEIPREFSASNLMVEITAKGIRKFQAIYASLMDVRITENYGQVAVSEKQTQKPLAGVYVKVYGLMKDGKTEFYKDGYTDILGRFDYASLTTDKVDLVEKFALLIMSDTRGAMIREVYPPKR